jgi:hypothetical protein
MKTQAIPLGFFFCSKSNFRVNNSGFWFLLLSTTDG